MGLAAQHGPCKHARMEITVTQSGNFNKHYDMALALPPSCASLQEACRYSDSVTPIKSNCCTQVLLPCPNLSPRKSYLVNSTKFVCKSKNDFSFFSPSTSCVCQSAATKLFQAQNLGCMQWAHADEIQTYNGTIIKGQFGCLPFALFQLVEYKLNCNCTTLQKMRGKMKVQKNSS